MNKKITEKDVYSVAKDLNFIIDNIVVDQVLTMFDEEAENDPTATWELIIENILYNLMIN